jgi:D-beta-D-heptose 7-phosphate kinase/D-beta-D-heptose 1-phosphate adenosyltransferase
MSKISLEKFLQNPSSKTIVAFGDYIRDEYWIGNSTRISPEAPVPIIKHDKILTSHGGVGNVICNLLCMGASVEWVTRHFEQVHYISHDKLRIHTNNKNNSYDVKCPTKIRIISNNNQVARYDIEDDYSVSDMSHPKNFGDYIKKCYEVIDNSDLVVISDYNKGFLSNENISQILSICQGLEKPVIVDTKKSRTEALQSFKGVTTITPNKKELYQLIGEDSNILDVESALKKLKKDYKLKFSTVTLSEEGIMIWDGKRFYHNKLSPIEVFDVTGAGDSSLAALAVGYANNMSLEDCAQLANLAGSIAVQHHRTYYVSLDDLKQSKVVSSIYDIERYISRVRNQGKTIVFTNGCFDILHPGHIDLLQEAKNEGDFLVVGINSDESIKRIKGNSRPIMNQQERSQMLNALSCVDKVVIFDEDTPLALIEEIQPDVLVKGDEWAGNIIGSEFAKKVHLVKLKKDIHTSAIIDRIKET